MTRKTKVTLTNAVAIAAIFALAPSSVADTYRGDCSHWKNAAKQHYARARVSAIAGADDRYEREIEKHEEAMRRYNRCLNATRATQPTDKQKAAAAAAVGLAIGLGIAIGGSRGRGGGGH